MTRPDQNTNSFDPIVPTQQDVVIDRASNASSAVTCLARLLGRLAAKAHADERHSKQFTETEHD
jgi:hypothetical protein